MIIYLVLVGMVFTREEDKFPYISRWQIVHIIVPVASNVGSSWWQHSWFTCGSWWRCDSAGIGAFTSQLAGWTAPTNPKSRHIASDHIKHKLALMDHRLDYVLLLESATWPFNINQKSDESTFLKQPKLAENNQDLHHPPCLLPPFLQPP